jgi:hypothetical protein
MHLQDHFFLNVKYQSSYNGCTKCEQAGYLDPSVSATIKTKPKKVIRYQTEIGTLRTDLSFKYRVDKAHHHPNYKDPNNQTILERVLDFPMVSMVPIDSMHCMDLGVTKKIHQVVRGEKK